MAAGSRKKMVVVGLGMVGISFMYDARSPSPTSNTHT